MSDTKELIWDDAGAPGTEAGVTEDGSGKDGRRSWDAYRNWLSRAPAPTSAKRSGPDASIYTWKGYRNWSDQVKRNWTDRTDEDL